MTDPNVTLVEAPDQTDFEKNPEWVLSGPEVIDYGENLAEGKRARQNGQAQVYHCKNATARRPGSRSMGRRAEAGLI